MQRVIPALFITFLLSCTAARFARAEAMPWIDNRVATPKTRLYVLDDAYVEMAMRIDLIRHAKRTIRIAVFHQTVDAELGMPILQALRAASARGIRIQFVTGGVPAQLFDRDDLMNKMLCDPALRWPARIVEFGGFSNLKKGWNISDAMHEKIFLIDDEVAIVGGRNQGKDYLHWLDFGTLVVDKKKNGLVREVRKAFDQLWFDMASFAEEIPPVTVRPGDIPDPATNTEVALTPGQKTEFATTQRWLIAARGNAPAAEHFTKEFKPAKVRVITHRFFDLLATGKYNGENRINIPDEIIDEVVALVPQAREIRISTLFVLFNPKLKTALVTALQQGATLYMHFNGDKTARENVPLGLSYKDSLEDIIDLMKVRQKDGSPAKVHAAVMEQAKYRYLHKKLFVVDDHVFFGSHNYNLPSTIANSEDCIEVHDASFAEALTLAYDHDFVFSGRPLTMKEAAADYEHSTLSRWFAKFVHSFF